MLAKTDGSRTILPPLQCANEEVDVMPTGFEKVAIVIQLQYRSHDHADLKANPVSLLGLTGWQSCMKETKCSHQPVLRATSSRESVVGDGDVISGGKSDSMQCQQKRNTELYSCFMNPGGDS